MLKYFFLILISIQLFAIPVKKGDHCMYRFLAEGNYDARMKMVVLSVEKNSYKVELDFKSGTVHYKKTFKMDKVLPKENFLKYILEITSTYSKDKIEIISEKLTEDYKIISKDRTYKGYLIEGKVKIDGIEYDVSYTFSDSIPIMGLVRFGLIRTVKTHKEYKLDNRMLVTTFGREGKEDKL